MEDGYRWVTIPGRGPVKIKTTNEYMNNLIRNNKNNNVINWKKYVPEIEYDSEEVVEKYKREIMNNKHRPILVNNDRDIIDGNHAMKAYQELNIRPPKLYLGERYDFFEEVQKTNFNEIEAIENMLKNKKARKI